MELKRRIVFALAICLLIIAGPWACSSKNTVQNGFDISEYKKSAEIQKQKDAVADENIANKLSPMTSADYERLGDSFFQQGSLEMAFVQYMHAVSAASPDAAQNSLRYKIGRLYLRKGITDQAMATFEGMLKYDANSALAYEGIGRTYFKENNVKKAEENYLQALNLDTKLWTARNALGVLYDRQGRFDEAIAQFQAAILIQPASGSLFNNLGMAYLYKGQYDKAVRSLSEALRVQGSNAKIYNNLALAFYKAGNEKDALEAFKRAEGQAAALNNLGYLLMVDGKQAGAIKYLEEAIEAESKYYERAHENMLQAKGQLLVK
jgi:Flp pilus assembly protein TadD